MKKLFAILALAAFASIASAQYSGPGAPTLTCSSSTNAGSTWIDSLSGTQYVCNSNTPAGYQWNVAPAGAIPGSASSGLLVTRYTNTQLLVANMTAAATAGVAVGSTGTGNSTFSFPVVSGNWYDLRCTLPVTFAASATIGFGLIQNATATVSYGSIEETGSIGASAVPGSYSAVAQTSLAATTTGSSGAPGAVSVTVSVDSQYLASASGTVGIQFVGNGTNNVTVLKGGECRETQIN